MCFKENTHNDVRIDVSPVRMDAFDQMVSMIFFTEVLQDLDLVHHVAFGAMWSSHFPAGICSATINLAAEVFRCEDPWVSSTSIGTRST